MLDWLIWGAIAAALVVCVYVLARRPRFRKAHEE